MGFSGRNGVDGPGGAAGGGVGPAGAAGGAPGPAPGPAGAVAARRRILRLALPAIGEMLLHMTVWMVDTAMVGRLSAAALGAVGLGGQVYFSAMFAVGAVSVGATALVARHVGAEEPRRAAFYGGQAITLNLALGVLLATAVHFVAPGVYLLARLGPQVADPGVAYLRIISLSAPFHLANLAMGAVLRGSGDTRTPLYVTGLTNLLNVVGDYVLIFGAWGFPRLEVAGAALASAGSIAVGSLAYVAVYLWGRRQVRPRLADLFPPDWGAVRRLLRLSVPAGLENALMDGARTFNMFILAALGTVPFAAAQVAITAESVSFMPGYGFTVAASVLAGQNLGAGALQRAERETWQAWRMSLAVMGGMGLLFLAFPRALVSVFTSDPGVIKEAARCLWVAAFAQPFVATTEVLCGALRGAGDTRTPLGITLLGAWALRVPLVLAGVRLLGLPLVYAWAAMVLDWVCRAALSAVLFRRGRWMRTRV